MDIFNSFIVEPITYENKIFTILRQMVATVMLRVSIHTTVIKPTCNLKKLVANGKEDYSIILKANIMTPMT